MSVVPTQQLFLVLEASKRESEVFAWLLSLPRFAEAIKALWPLSGCLLGETEKGEN